MTLRTTKMGANAKPKRLLMVLVAAGAAAGFAMAPSVGQATSQAAASEGQCQAGKWSEDRPRYCGTPPSIVYRADKRDPAIIFSTGFESRGEGLDLVEHVLWDHKDGGASAYVATSADPAVAIRFSAMWSYSKQKSYIYFIRADENVFNVIQSLEWQANNPLAHANKERIDEAITMGENEDEWVAILHIDPTNIKKACPITEPVEKDYLSHAKDCIDNPSYSDDKTRGSTQLLTG